MRWNFPPRFRLVVRAAATGLGLLLALDAARADDAVQIELAIKDHRFVPAEIRVPAQKPAVITLHNQDPTAEEFDSSALTIEKVIPGGRTGTIRLRPLDAGRYPFMGEYHADTAQGVVIVE